MKKAKTRTVPYRRVREGKTNYKRRLKILLGKKLRVVVRRSNKMIRGQVVDYFPEGDKVLFSVESKELLKFGWKGGLNNISSAYLSGILLAKKAGKKDAIFDIGMQTSLKSGVIYSFAKGCIDGGLKIECSEKMFPPEEKISGKHIDDFVEKIKKSDEKYSFQFKLIVERLGSLKLADNFDEVKKKILAK
jgi:large subunit ribosomal protein L18